jgi:hypothetical protein
MLGSLLGLGAMFIPGLQGAAPFLGAAGQLLSGNPMGAAMSAAGGLVGNANAPQVNQDSLTNALREAWRNEYGLENVTSGWDDYRQLLNQSEYNNLRGLWGNQNRRRTF